MSFHVEDRGQRVELLFFCNYVCSEGHTQAIRVGNKCLYPLSHLVGPGHGFKLTSYRVNSKRL